MIKAYLLENWALILVTMAFAIILKTTIFLETKMKRRMYILIASVFLLSFIVFAEFNQSSQGMSREVRTVLTAIRYSATPFIMAMILYTLVKKVRWFVFTPAIVFTIFNVVSIFTGIVFSADESNTLVRGPLGYLPYVAVGLYSALLIYTLFRNCNKQSSEIIPIVFMSLAFISGLVMPFILGKDYSKIFCTTIMIALFVYYDFSILQLTSKDALTGLLNRQAFYSAIDKDAKTVTGVVSIDMNGLKKINDIEGHAAGDEAIETLASCFMRAKNSKHSVYRIGGDEFTVLCRKSSEDEIKELVERIKKNISETKYTCSIGYCFCANGEKTIVEMIEASDEMMYADKEHFYLTSGIEKHRK